MSSSVCLLVTVRINTYIKILLKTCLTGLTKKGWQKNSEIFFVAGHCVSELDQFPLLNSGFYLFIQVPANVSFVSSCFLSFLRNNGKVYWMMHTFI